MRQARLYVVAVILLGMLAIVYSSPMIRSIAAPAGREMIARTLEDPDGLRAPLIRSAFFAVVTALLSVVLGFYGAVALAPRMRSSRRLLLFLIIPLLGSVAVAVAVHLDVRYRLLHGLVAERDFFVTWLLLVLTQLWQFAPLFLYLFAVQLTTVSTDRHLFTMVSGASWGERVRDIDWPHCRNLARLLTLFAVAEGTREFVKPAMILRASPGTATEMITARLERHYAIWSKANFSTAVNGTLAGALLVTVVAALLAVLTIALADRLLRGSTAGLAHSRMDWGIGKVGVVALLALTAVPLIGALNYVDPAVLSDLPWSTLGVSVCLAGVAVAATMIVAVVFSISARVIFPDRLARFDSHALPVFLILFAIRLVPPIAIVLCGLHWLYRSGTLTTTTAVTVWVAAQMVITFPLLASFAQFTHFAVRTDEIAFHRVSRAWPWEVARDSFLLRFGPEYALIAVFGLAIILGEDAINSIMAFAVPSIAHELSLRVGGRSGSYREAVMIVALLAIPVVSAISTLASLKRDERAVA